MDLPALLAGHWNQGLAFEPFVERAGEHAAALREWEAKTVIEPETSAAIKALPGEVRLLAIGAAWCGDCRINLPSAARLAALTPKIQFRIVDRDRHEDLMNEFLTNGAKAIPKIIAATPDFSRLAAWGARPAGAQAIMTANKERLPKPEIHAMIRDWYAADLGRTTTRELAAAALSLFA